MGQFKVLKGPVSRRQSGAIGVPRKSRERRDQPKAQQTRSSPHPQHLGREQERTSALSDLLPKNPFVRAEDLLRGSLVCADTCPARGGLAKGTHRQFGRLQPSSTRSPPKRGFTSPRVVRSPQWVQDASELFPALSQSSPTI